MEIKKIEIVSMELIRPTSPTPNHLRCFEFSYLDQMAPTTSVPLALFYPPPPPSPDELYASSYDQAKAANSSRLLLLKKSLSETLAWFYPFAGRIKANSIECNDEGVPFYVAFAHNYQLEDVLGQAEVDVHFLPTIEDDSLFTNSSTCVPLLVQVTIFECGSMAISTRVSHKIVDRSSSCTLIDAWAVTTRGGTECTVSEFVAAAKFLPPPNPQILPTLLESRKISLGDNQYAGKIFVFGASTIASLKAKAISDVARLPTRVEVVSAVIWRCCMATSGIERRSSYLIQNVNMRKRFVPPLPINCVGNVVAVSTACKGENDCSDLPTLVYCIRKGLLELSSKYKDKQNRDEAIFAIPYESMELTRAFRQREIDVLLYLNSWCGYQFYDIDFGWGKPSWVSPVERHKNVIFLMDSRDSGGIDAWVCLKENEMEVFERELFGFCKS